MFKSHIGMDLWISVAVISICCFSSSIILSLLYSLLQWCPIRVCLWDISIIVSLVFAPNGTPFIKKCLLKRVCPFGRIWILSGPVIALTILSSPWAQLGSSSWVLIRSFCRSRSANTIHRNHSHVISTYFTARNWMVYSRNHICRSYFWDKGD